MDCLSIALLAFKEPLFYLVMDPKNKTSNAGYLDMPKRSHKVLPLGETVCVYREKSIYIGFGTIHGFRHPLGILERTPAK